MVEEDFSNEEEGTEQQEGNSSREQGIIPNGFIDQELLLLLFILLIFFSKRDIFSEHLQFLNQQANNVKTYLEAADATLQALDQASQMPKQILN
ncbi:hypothetical protein [Halanaerobacter jeridensis]|uniref:Uncharacterized protein n=1 Tax=Halanaerobacter jeridensis TaxID=706427 RepID=A0A939BPU6_9FIRM|nr:hypothetical protein [Halanaerobacter jeridensis]MBM7557497.1 hypothetical protein [Halanaerobacter jeridensis]